MSNTPSTSRDKDGFWIEIDSPKRSSTSSPVKTSSTKSLGDLKFNKINNNKKSIKEMSSTTNSTSGGSNSKSSNDAKDSVSSSSKKNGDSSSSSSKKDGKKRALEDDDDKKKKGNDNKDSNKSNGNGKDKDKGKHGEAPPTKKPRTSNVNTVTCHQDHKPHDKEAGNWLQCTSQSGRKPKPCGLYFCTRCLSNKYEEDVAKIKAEGKADTWLCPACRNDCKCATCRKRLEALGDNSAAASTSKETNKASTSKSTPASKNASSSTASSSKSKPNTSASFPFGQSDSTSTSKLSNSNQVPDSVSSLSELASDVDSLSSLSDDEEVEEDTKAKQKKGGRISVVKAKDGGGSDTSISTVNSKSKLKLAVEKLNGLPSTSNASNASTPAPENANGVVAAPRRPIAPRGPKPISAPLASPIFLPSSPSRPGLPTAAILSAMHIREYILRFSKFMPSLSPLPQAKISKKKKQARNTRGNQSKNNNSKSKPEPGVLSYHAAKARETRRLSILSGLEDFETFWSKDSDLSQRAILQGLFELIVGPPMAHHERDILSTYDTLALFRNCHKALHEAGPNATSVELTNKPWRLLEEFLELEGWKWELEPELAVLEEFGLTDEEENRGKSTRSGTIEVGTVQRMRMILAFIQGSYAATLMKKDIIDGIEIERSQRAELNRRKFKVRGELAEEKSNLNKSKPVKPTTATPGGVSGDRILKEWKEEIEKIDEKIKEIEKVKRIEGWKVQQELHKMACATRIRFISSGIDVEGRNYYILAPTPSVNYPYTKPTVPTVAKAAASASGSKVADDSDVDELDEDQEIEEAVEYQLPWTILVHGIPFPPPIPAEVKPVVAAVDPVASTSASTASTSKAVAPTPVAPSKVVLPPPPKADAEQTDTWFAISQPEEMSQLKTYIDYQVKYFNFEQKLISHTILFPPTSTSRSKDKGKGKALLDDQKDNLQLNEKGEYVELECRNILELNSNLETFYQYIEMEREDERVRRGGKKFERRESSEELSEIESSEEESEEEEEEVDHEEVSDEETSGGRKSTNRSTTNKKTSISKGATTFSNNSSTSKPKPNYKEVDVEDGEGDEIYYSEDLEEEEEEPEISRPSKTNRSKTRSAPNTRSSSSSLPPSTRNSSSNAKKNPYKKLGKMIVDDDEEEDEEEIDELDELESEEEEAVESGNDKASDEDVEEDSEEEEDEMDLDD